MEHFISLPQEIIGNGIFPFLSPLDINKLCQTHSYFGILCHNELLWNLKVLDEFPEYHSFNSPRVSWKNYYLLLARGKFVPLYYHGDEIAYIPFHRRKLDLTKSLIEIYLQNLTDDLRLVFLDRQLNPIMIIQYPEKIIREKPPDVSIYKIIIVNNPWFNQIIDSEETTENWEARIRTLVIHELASPLNQLPIYGACLGSNISFIDDRENNESFCLMIKGDENFTDDLHICIYLRRQVLLDILWRLKKCSSPQFIAVPVNEKIQLLREYRIPYTNYSCEQVDFYYTRLLNSSKTELSEEIYNSLWEIGHIL